ncbi:MAG: PCRF domain-containing protein, partial [Burkholderiales bacterium]
MACRISRSVPRGCGGIFDYDTKTRRLEELVKLSEDPALWNDAARAQEVGRERKTLEGIVVTLRDLDRNLTDARELYEMGRAE